MVWGAAAFSLLKQEGCRSATFGTIVHVLASPPCIRMASSIVAVWLSTSFSIA